MVAKLFKCAGIACLFMLSACGGSSYSPYGGTENPTQVKIGKPYDVSGETFVPHYDEAYNEEGMASWYGPKFHGRMTASGERYDQNEMTAAHRTLPMPSIVRVTRLDTGQSVKVRVNDRGPFSHRRIIDLSQGAAEALDMIRVGTTKVRVEYLSQDTEEYIASLGLPKPEGWGGSPTTFAAVPTGDITASELAPPAPHPLMDASLTFDPSPAAVQEAPVARLDVAASPPVPASTSANRYHIQAGSFGNPKNAERVAQDLRALAATMINPVLANGQHFYRVSLGPLNGYSDAERLLEQVRALGYRDARIMVDDI